MEKYYRFDRQTALVALTSILLIVAGCFMLNGMIREILNPILTPASFSWRELPFLMLASFPIWLGVGLIGALLKRKEIGMPFLSLSAACLVLGYSLLFFFTLRA